MADANIKAVITAEDKASNVLKDFGNSSSLSFFQMAGAVAAGTLALQGLEKVANSVVGIFNDSINTTLELGKNTLSLERTFGLTAEQGSSLLAVFDRFGVDADNASKSLGIFETKMLAAKDGTNTAGNVLKQYGISSVDAAGNLRNMNDVLLDVADAFKNQIPITERAAVARDLFGRAGQALIPALIQGKDGIKALTEEAQREGVVLSQDNVNAVLANARAHAKLDEAVKGVKNQVGLALIPIITGAINKLLDWVNANGGVEKIMTEKVIPVLQEVINWLKDFAQNELPSVIKGLQDFIGFVAFVANAFKSSFDTIHGAADILNGALWALLDIAKFVIDNVVKLFKNLPGWILEAVKGAGDWLYNTGKDIINGIVRGIEDAVGGVGNAIGKVGDKVGSAVKNALHNIHVPGFASGVQNFGGGLAVVGEQGPELVSLPGGSSVIPNNQISGGGSNVNVTFNGVFTGNEQEFRKLAIRVFQSASDAASMQNNDISTMTSQQWRRI